MSGNVGLCLLVGRTLAPKLLNTILELALGGPSIVLHHSQQSVSQSRSFPLPQPCTHLDLVELLLLRVNRVFELFFENLHLVVAQIVVVTRNVVLLRELADERLARFEHVLVPLHSRNEFVSSKSSVKELI